MAIYVHAIEPNYNGPIVKLISIDPGATEKECLTVRYLTPMSAALIRIFFLKGRYRHGFKILSNKERVEYLTSRAVADIGSGI